MEEILEIKKLQKQVEFYKNAATNLTGSNFILQHAISEFEKYINKEISYCSLAIMACGTDEKTAFVYRKYRDNFRKKLKDLNIEKILFEGKISLPTEKINDYENEKHN